MSRCRRRKAYGIFGVMNTGTREVREHNNFAKRMPVVEEQIKVINHQIENLEEFHKGA